MKKLSILATLPLLLLTSCAGKEDRTPLGWCLWEISKHEGYEKYAYTYQELSAYDMEEYHKYENSSVKGYIITTYSYPLKTEWFCEIEYKNYSNPYFSKDDIYYLDCDILVENSYE